MAAPSADTPDSGCARNFVHISGQEALLLGDEGAVDVQLQLGTADQHHLLESRALFANLSACNQ